jgi:hypothetical protein
MIPAAVRRARSIRLGFALLAVWIALGPRDGLAGSSLHQELTIRLDPVTRELTAEAEIRAQGLPVVEFALARQFTVERLLVNGASAPISPHRAQAFRNRWRIPVRSSPLSQTVTVRYRGRLEPLMTADHREVLSGLPPMADARGSFLPGGTGWYPELAAPAFTYRLLLDLPESQRGLVPGRLSEERIEAGRYLATFTFPHPADSIELIAGPYRIQERSLSRTGGEPIRLRTYFHPEIADLAEGYLSAIGRYIELYSRWIGPYPFGEFSVVSSPLPTGFGMPTLTYLGIDVLRLPFIRQSSLGHEILHNWWGNGVAVDYTRGNWAEGLTAFMADYTYKEREGADAAREARLGFLRDMAAVPTGQDAPLREFVSRTHGTSQVVGYHKGAFLFLMLRDHLGFEAFDRGIQRFWRDQQFRRASWADLRRAFEQASGRDLGGFFDQWLSRQGVPRLTIESLRAERDSVGYRVRIVVKQGDPAYTLTVPVVVTTAEGKVERRPEVAGSRQELVIAVDHRPLSVALDPDARILRQLDPAEVPPILRQAILDPATVTVLLGSDESIRGIASDLARGLLDHPPRFAEPHALPDSVPLLVIGLTPHVERFLTQAGLPPRPASLGARGSARFWTATQRSGKVLVVVEAETPEALAALLRPLPHYGRQSYLVFEGSRAIERGVWPARHREWAVLGIDGVLGREGSGAAPRN